MTRPSGSAPLVWFTSLAIGGAGFIAAAVRARVDSPSSAAALAIGTGALGAGLLVSLLHLGRASRAPLAARGVGRSALSDEVVLAAATFAAGVALLPTYWWGSPHAWMRIGAATIAILFLVSLGRVYRLGGQRTWQGAAILLPITTGLVCGDVGLLAIDGGATSGTSVPFWPILIPVDAMAFALRWWALVHSARRRRADVNRLHRLSAARLLVVDVIPLALLNLHAAGVAAIAVVTGLAFDRWLFYALADQHTTEGEIADVEAAIERRSRIG